MTFGLFTSVASRAPGKHIHKYVPASGSVSGYIRHPSSGSEAGVFIIRILKPGLHHPVPKPGTLHPASCRVYFIRLHAGYSSSGYHRVFLAGSGHPIRSLPAPDIPSGGTVILTVFASVICSNSFQLLARFSFHTRVDLFEDG